MSGHLSQMIKAEWKEREFSESPRGQQSRFTHKRIRDAPRGGFFQDFTLLCFCFTLQPWNWNSVNMDKELRSAYRTPIRLYKARPADGRRSHMFVVAVCVCFQLSSVFQELRFMGMDQIWFRLICSCSNVISHEQFVRYIRGDCGLLMWFWWWNDSKPRVFLRKYLGF